MPLLPHEIQDDRDNRYLKSIFNSMTNYVISCAILNAHTNGKSHMKNVLRMHHRRNEKFQSLDFYDTSYKLTINEITCLDRDIHIPCPICIEELVCGKIC